VSGAVTNADIALLVEAYAQIVPKIQEASATFVDAAPTDPLRQIRLQSKLMTAVLANFIQTMPSLTGDELFQIFEIAVTAAGEPEHQPERVLDKDMN
jgi:hypothetical protein